jgi:SAM-dependent methyltransferase
MESNREHWNRIYTETEEHRLGWYEEDPAPTFDLLCQVEGWEKAAVFLPGAGTSVLAEQLLDAGAQLVINDLSSSALEQMRDRLGERGDHVVWICQDIARPLGAEMPPVDIWIDRAVLHFLTDEEDINGYFENVRARLKPGGHALFTEFPPHGAPKCAGLELHRYSLEELAQRLGRDFELVDAFDYTYMNPAGEERPYIYAAFKRKEAR